MRLLHAAMAAILLVLLAPLLLLLVLANAIVADRVLFRQVRLGRNLRPFTLVKLSTMAEGAEREGTLTLPGDPRVTRLGRFLRRFKLDELPQLLHVVRGEMGLVGPRALPPAEIATLPTTLAAEVYSVRPGLTGIGSIAFIDEEGVLASSGTPRETYFNDVLPRKMQLELDYRRRSSAGRDLALVLLTVPALLFPGTRPRIVRWLLA
jgi:lipopolysaccharide/colanic/teichoic acid biosynthesis glycosyltransferase